MGFELLQSAAQALEFDQLLPLHLLMPMAISMQVDFQKVMEDQWKIMDGGGR